MSDIQTGELHSSTGDTHSHQTSGLRGLTTHVTLVTLSGYFVLFRLCCKLWCGLEFR